MRGTVPSSFFLLFLVAVAVFGLAVVPLILLEPNLQADQMPYRRPLISALYSAVCVLGVVAVFYPRRCRLMFKKPNVSPNPNASASSTVQFRGHHPDCEKFNANRITIRGRAFCAACSGLLIGTIVALVGVVLFSLGFFDFGSGSLGVLVAGEVLMLLGLGQIKMKGYSKMAVNGVFVIASFSILVAADLLGQSLLLDVYVLGLIVFLLWLRILLSEWHNKRICLVCGDCG
ncbi:MAG: hypothetical protein NWE96_01955 [Candidatus Bathyarchaeota archaeon]|nr:hypothetical protein [Candidatus Bathyarchaeota archaeon]